MKIVAEIPARYGSQRVKQKNLRMLNGKPMMCYAIDAAKGVKRFDEIYVNTENDIIGQIALDRGVKYYKRSEYLASDEATSDQFNYDFIKNIGADIFVMVNTVSPLIVSVDIDKALDIFLEKGYDSLITTREERLHAFCNNIPVNFDSKGMLPRTQDILPVNICVWTLCVWRAKTFIKAYEKNGSAVFSGKVGFFPIDPLKSVKISYEEDFLMAETLLKIREEKNG